MFVFPSRSTFTCQGWPTIEWVNNTFLQKHLQYLQLPSLVLSAATHNKITRHWIWMNSVIRFENREENSKSKLYNLSLLGKICNSHPWLTFLCILLEEGLGFFWYKSLFLTITTWGINYSTIVFFFLKSVFSLSIINSILIPWHCHPNVQEWSENINM